jgi:O-antigen ligase
MLAFGIILSILGSGTGVRPSHLQLKDFLLLIFLSTLFHIAVIPSSEFLTNHSGIAATRTGSRIFLTADNWDDVTLTAGVRWFISILLASFVSYVVSIDKKFTFHKIAYAWLFGILINGLVAIIESFGILGSFGEFSNGFDRELRFSGVASHPNMLGTVALMGAPFAYTLYKSKKNLTRRYFFLAQNVILGFAIFLSGSRVCLILFPLSIMLSYWTEYKMYRWKFLALCSYFFILTPFLFSINQSNFLYQNISKNRLFNNDVSVSVSNEGRIDLYQSALQEIYSSYFLGYGPALNKDAHSIYLQLAVSLGIIGLILFLRYIWKVLRLNLNPQMDDDFWIIPFKLAFLMFCLNNIVNNSLTEFYVYFPLVIVMTFLRMKQEHNYNSQSRE